ncbi:MAG: RNA polymerase sigma factor RpoD/SigA [Myxococcota bacterium]
MFDTPIVASSSHARRPRPAAGRSTLDLYLDRASRYPRLTADEERAQLVHLTALRRHWWQMLLCEAAAYPKVAEVVEQELDQSPRDVLEDAEQARRALLEGRSERAQDAFDRCVAALAIELEALDVDGQLVERLCKQLNVDGLDAEVERRYRQRVRLARMTYHRARNRFVCSNLRLVLKVAERYSGHWMSLVDRVQEGNLGLLTAAERFDPDRGTRFSTYAVWWIRHAITRALVNRGRAVRIPANLHVIFTKVRRAKSELTGRLGRTPTLEELAGEIDVPLARVRAAVEAMELRSISLDGSPDDSDDALRPDALGLPAPQAAIDDLVDQRRAEALAKDAMKNLAPRDKDILERRFALAGRAPMTLEALGRCYQISRERVRQLQKRALATLRYEVESSPLNGLAFV